MPLPIELNSKLQLRRVEIENELLDAMLPAELDGAEATASQSSPEDLLGLGLRFAEVPLILEAGFTPAGSAWRLIPTSDLSLPLTRLASLATLSPLRGARANLKLGAISAVPG